MRKAAILSVTVFSVAVLALLYTADSSSASSKVESQTVTLQVTSANPDLEVSFEGSIVVGGSESKYISVAQKTPYSFTAEANSLSAQFNKTDGDANLHIEVQRFNIDDQKGMTSGTGTGSIILVLQGFNKVSNDFIVAM